MTPVAPLHTISPYSSGITYEAFLQKLIVSVTDIRGRPVRGATVQLSFSPGSAETGWDGTANAL